MNLGLRAEDEPSLNSSVRCIVPRTPRPNHYVGGPGSIALAQARIVSRDWGPSDDDDLLSPQEGHKEATVSVTYLRKRVYADRDKPPFWRTLEEFCKVRNSAR